MEFFRHCPECGRRFHIKLVDKQLVSKEKELIPTKRVITGQYTYLGARQKRPMSGGPTSYSPTVVVEGEPMVIDFEEFQYAYRCKHCGHEWAEKHVEKHKEG